MFFAKQIKFKLILMQKLIVEELSRKKSKKAKCYCFQHFKQRQFVYKSLHCCLALKEKLLGHGISF